MVDELFPALIETFGGAREKLKIAKDTSDVNACVETELPPTKRRCI